MIYHYSMRKNLNQGKRKEQITFSEQMVTYGVLGIITLVIYLAVIKVIENL